MDLEKALIESISQLLYLEGNELDVDRPFNELGLDSILGVEWTKWLNNTYQLDIKATTLYDYPTIKELAVFIEEQLNGRSETQKSRTLNDKPDSGALREEATGLFGIPVIYGKELQEDHGITFDYSVSVTNNACLRDHLVFGKHVMPTDGYIEMIYSAFSEYFGVSRLGIKGIQIHHPFIGEAEQVYSVRLSLKALSDGRIRFIIRSRRIHEDHKGQIHIQGFVEVLDKSVYQTSSERHPHLTNVVEISKDDFMFFGTLRGMYSGSFTSLTLAEEQARGEITIEHPVSGSIAQLLDMALLFSIHYGLYKKGAQQDHEVAYLPYKLAYIKIRSKVQPGRYECTITVDEIIEGGIVLTFEVIGANGKNIITVERLQLRGVRSDQIQLQKNDTNVVIERNSAIEKPASATDIAIVGMSCRFPEQLIKRLSGKT